MKLKSLNTTLTVDTLKQLAIPISYSDSLYVHSIGTQDTTTPKHPDGVLKITKTNPNIPIRFVSLENSIVESRMFSGSSLVSNGDMLSHLDYFIALKDYRSSANIRLYSILTLLYQKNNFLCFFCHPLCSFPRL